MVRTPSHPERDSAAKPPLWRRLAWLAGIWTASVLALGVAAWLMRLFSERGGAGRPALIDDPIRALRRPFREPSAGGLLCPPIRQCSVLRRRASILAFPPCTIQAGSADNRAAVIRPTGAADAPY